MKFSAFTAVAPVLGKDRCVVYNADPTAGALLIQSVGPDDVMRILAVLSGTPMVEVQAPAEKKAPPTEAAREKMGAGEKVGERPADTEARKAVEKAPEKPVEASAEKPATETPAPVQATGTGPRRGRAPKAEPPPAPPVETPPAEPVVKTAGVSAADVAAAAKPAEKKFDNYLEGDNKPEAEPSNEIPFGADDEKSGAIPAELPVNIANAARLRDVLDYLMTFGYTTPAQLVTGCELIKDRCALVGRIDNIADRVTRTLQVMGNG